MSLRSSKALIKRPKPANLDEIEQDFISNLHDALLIQILSLLPGADANRMRVLSTRWKDLLAFLPNLHFVMPSCRSIEEVNKFHDSVDQTLDVRGGCFVGAYTVVIKAPKLEYLNVMDVTSTTYDLTKPLSLTEAHISLRNDGQVKVRSVARLVRCISSVEILSLTDSTLKALMFSHGLNMPMFLNVVKFVVDVTRNWNNLPTFLDNMPNLEHLTFSNGLLPFPRPQQICNMRWRPLAEVPACLRFKMKEIIIENRETISPGEFNFIRYVLKHSNNLEILAINAHEIDARRRDKVLKFYRGSVSCRIEFL